MLYSILIGTQLIATVPNLAMCEQVRARVIQQTVVEITIKAGFCLDGQIFASKVTCVKTRDA